MEELKAREYQEVIHDLDTIIKEIRETLKKEFPAFKFSLRQQHYSGGRSIHLSIMESPIKIIKPYEEISERVFFQLESRHYTKDQIKTAQANRYHQLNGYTLYEEYNPDNWNNGVFLTEQGFKALKRINEILNLRNYDHSDIQSDYSDLNYYTHFSLGKWDKDFKQNGE